MEGTLDTFGIVKIVKSLARDRSSGTLHVECPQRLVDVHFVHGRIAETRDSTRVGADTVLGRQLLKRSLVSEVHLSEALAHQETNPCPVGTLLVRSGHVDERDLRDVLSRQIAHTLLAARLEAKGTFLFESDDHPVPVDFVTLTPSRLLASITALGSDYCLAIEILGQSDPVLVRNGDYKTLPRDPKPFGRDELVILAQVDGRRSVTEIGDASGLERVTALGVLGALVEAGVLLVRAGTADLPSGHAMDQAAAATAPQLRKGGTIDQALMRSHMEEMRLRLKAKAFDAMISGEAALLSLDSGMRPVPSGGDLGLDTGLESMIDDALSEEEY